MKNNNSLDEGSQSLKIVYEDNDILIINKQAGLTVNRSESTTHQLTLQDLIEKENKINTLNQDQEFIQRSGVVHRLDKETSGLILIAKNTAAFRNLQAQFKDRTIEKDYIALTHGEIVPKIGEINVPVGRLPWNRKRFGVVARGRPSKTAYEALETLSDGKEKYSLVRLFPKTGRTHQIRVHLKYINHPILGDPLYGGRKTSRNDRKKLQRFFLHAQGISFTHPTTGERMTFKADLPKELLDVIATLKSKNNNIDKPA